MLSGGVCSAEAWGARSLDAAEHQRWEGGQDTEPLVATLSEFAYGVETPFAGIEEGPLVFPGDGWGLSHINNKGLG